LPPLNEYDDDRLERITRAVGRIEGKLDSWGDLPKRIEKLESWKSWLSGAWAVVAAICMYLWDTRPKI
jgi:hypothetical protein